jgi:hypothetical protein
VAAEEIDDLFARNRMLRSGHAWGGAPVQRLIIETARSYRRSVLSREAAARR